MNESILYDDKREYVFEIPVRSWNGSKKLPFWALFLFLLIKLFFLNFYHFQLRAHMYVIKTFSTPLRSLIKTFWEYFICSSSPSAYLITDSFSIFRKIQYKSINISRLKSLTVLSFFVSFVIIYSYRKPGQIEVYFNRLNLC